MKIYFHLSGDHEVGIWDVDEEIELGEYLSECFKDLDNDDREKFRAKIQAILWFLQGDQKPDISFEDECGECGTIMADRICKSNHCLKNMENTE